MMAELKRNMQRKNQNKDSDEEEESESEEEDDSDDDEEEEQQKPEVVVRNESMASQRKPEQNDFKKNLAAILQ